MMNTSKLISSRLLRCMLVFGLLYFFSTNTNAQVSVQEGYILQSGFAIPSVTWKSEAEAMDALTVKVQDLSAQAAQYPVGNSTGDELRGKIHYYKTVHGGLLQGQTVPTALTSGVSFLFSLQNSAITTVPAKKNLYDESVNLLKK